MLEFNKALKKETFENSQFCYVQKIQVKYFPFLNK